MKIACFLPSLSGGGAERATVNLLAALGEYPLQLDLVLARAEGPYLEQVPPDVNVVDLGRQRVTRAIFPLRRYLRLQRPDVLLSHLSHASLASITAALLARSSAKKILVEHLTMSAYQGTVRRDRWIRPLARWLYPRADAIICVSQGAARDLEQQLRLPSDSVRVIYNPVVNQQLLVQAAAEPDMSWFAEETPVFLAVGRLTPQKNFAALLEAFALVRREIDSRLVILGEGEQREQLAHQIAALELRDHVDLPGFVANPYSLMRRAACLVLSSRWEALPTVIIEALACGCPIVSTDCPTGPAEILSAGRFGALVQTDDIPALAAAMRQTLLHPPDRQPLVERGMFFSFERAAREYYELFRQVCQSS